MKDKKEEIFVKLQAKWIKLNEIKNGDEVKVIRGFTKDEQGCTSGYHNSIDRYIGKTYTIQDNFREAMSHGINLSSGPVVPYFCLEPVKAEDYKVGQRFTWSGEEYILATVDINKICMICLVDGNRYYDSVKVKDVSNITSKDFSKVCSGDEAEFTLIK